VRLNAYVLAGDPAWVAQSIRSYYEHVERIVVSYDRSGRSWSGAPLSVDESLARIAHADPEGKVTLLPGDHVRTDGHVLSTETRQRQAALDEASRDADWVVQLDTDEIIPSMPTALAHLRIAHSRGARAMEFPARMIYARTPSGAFLEHCGRFWNPLSGFPGPIVVAAGTQLSLARQSQTSPLYRVDVSPWNTDPAHAFRTPVHAVIPRSQAIIHMSWVRTEAQMAEKSVVSGYASTRDWDADLRRWRRRARHPWATTLSAPLTRDPFSRYRVVRIPEFAGSAP
jgi:hypothetical protein